MAETQAQCYKQVNRYIEMLELTHLLGRTTQELSGGELQRVYFAKCLAQLNAFAAQKNRN
jgi:ABC-type Mn2+/Zn2+ transport system ATPase subunit